MTAVGVPRALFNMTEGYAPVRNILGAGDPNVHWIDDRWWMFFGGFRPTFRNNVFAATLAPGERLSDEARWRICTVPGQPQRAMALTEQPGRSEWDRYGLHEPSFVQATHDGRHGDPVVQRRIYYTGRGSRKVVGNDSPYAIGMLELTAAGWRRHSQPVLTGDASNPSALGPKVIHADGKWRMWFRATTGEPGKGQRPVAEIRYTESEDGISGWSPPRPFYSRADGFAHAFVRQVPEGYEMLLSKSPNLYGEPDYPEQKLWISTCAQASGDVAEWTEPRPILDSVAGAMWYRNGFFGASHCIPEAVPRDSAERQVFFTGVHTPLSWPKTALRRLSSGRRPPVPAPYYFTIGCVTLSLPADERGFESLHPDR